MTITSAVKNDGTDFHMLERVGTMKIKAVADAVETSSSLFTHKSRFN
jgi:hypothetical protein